MAQDLLDGGLSSTICGSHMQNTTAVITEKKLLPQDTLDFYRDVLQTLNRHSLPYLVGGAYAFNYYSAINRRTQDFDIFVARNNYDEITQVLHTCGYETDLTYPHWLGKVRCNGYIIDLIFSSGNGIANVDEAWFDHSTAADILGVPTRLCPPEEMIWSKAFIMEKERFDGADIAHLILACGEQLDWQRLLARFEPHWRLLLSHLTLFGFIYPTHRNLVPDWLMENLISRLKDDANTPLPEEHICGGTLLSREQYLNDVIERGYQDARIAPLGNMSEHDAVLWTKAIARKWDHS